MGTTALLVLGFFLTVAAVIAVWPEHASAHCDTADGPAAQDGLRALETGNPNYALKWIRPDDESELRDIFAQARQARTEGDAARSVADRWFLENLV